MFVIVASHRETTTTESALRHSLVLQHRQIEFAGKSSSRVISRLQRLHDVWPRLALSVTAGLIVLVLAWLFDFVPDILDGAGSLLTHRLRLPVWLVLLLLLPLLTTVVVVSRYALRTRATLARSATQPAYQRGHNAIILPTGFIAIIKASGSIAAVQALDQRRTSAGERIEYAWWCQKVKTTGDAESFRTSDVDHGVDEGPPLRVGTLTLSWSLGTDGLGWLYFGNEAKPPLDYELALSSEVDISRVEIASLKFEKYMTNESWNAS